MADAARARLAEHCTWLLEYQPTRGDQEIAADIIRALLAALAAAEQRATRLEALEAAARGYVNRPPNYQPWDKAEHALRMAVAALAAPPGEGA